MLLNTSDLLCHQYAGGDQHLVALNLFESSGRNLMLIIGLFKRILDGPFQGHRTSQCPGG
jgi:hypothetical protein